MSGCVRWGNRTWESEMLGISMLGIESSVSASGNRLLENRSTDALSQGGVMKDEVSLETLKWAIEM